MKFRKTVKEENKFLEYLNLMNGVFKLTQREREVFASFMEFEGDHDLDVLDIPSTDILSLLNRKEVMEKCNIIRNNLPNMIKKFRDKGLIVRDDQGRSRINRSIRPTKRDGSYTVEFIINIE